MKVQWKKAVLLAAAMMLPGEQVAARPQARPDLVVMLAIDQLGSILFDNYRGNYRKGLKRVIDAAGNSSQVLPSSMRPWRFLFRPPHCLKKKAVPDRRQADRISRTH